MELEIVLEQIQMVRESSLLTVDYSLEMLVVKFLQKEEKIFINNLSNLIYQIK